MIDALTKAMEASSSPTGWAFMGLGLLLFMGSVLVITFFAVTHRKNATVPILLAFAGMILVVIGRVIQFIATL